MAGHTLLSYSFMKEEPIDLNDVVTSIGSQDSFKCQENFPDSEFLCSDRGKAESTARDSNKETTTKQETPHFMSVTHATSEAAFMFDNSKVHCRNLDTLNLNTILKIEEMDTDDFKAYGRILNDDIGFKQRVKTNMLQLQGHRQEARKCSRNFLKPRAMMKIAKNYAELYSRDVLLPSPYPRFRDSIVIQCPACTMPRDQSRHSAFLELLLHVMERHSGCADSVFYKIGRTYASFIEGLKVKILKKLRNRQSKRLSRL
ncbi:uncharacterized protein LOC117652829 [Thrips palmi]|uniref:Uncharacterized protein LOC117652829 n=1 Tax=Thrips palmi TaxID=161013 RepID=A0A6P9A8M3_THRPL|nr:uncharacterized protein LOC117652829 [Thrips palmi]